MCHLVERPANPDTIEHSVRGCGCRPQGEGANPIGMAGKRLPDSFMLKGSTPPISQPTPSALSRADVIRVMSGAMTCVLLAAIDQTVVIPALPAIGSELGAYSQLSWVVAAYLITSTISTPVYGKLSDLYGRRRLLLTCIAIFIATSMLCAAAQSLDQLI